MHSPSPDTADTRSPWTDAFRAAPMAWPAADRPEAVHAPQGADTFAPQAPHSTAAAAGSEPTAEGWASEALFFLSNR
jgi:hypothetical protein